MHILDIPPELLSHILYFSILNRGVKRGLRLKLVCQSFHAAITPLLFRMKILDEARSGRSFGCWHRQTYYGSETLWHDYLVFRCRNETDESIGRFVEIRNIAYSIMQIYETQEQGHILDLDIVLNGLCWLALGYGTSCPGRRENWDNGSIRSSRSPDPNLSLLSAGTYFGCISLVRNMLGRGCDPTQHNGLFPPPMYLAAWTGRADLLQIMQERLPELEDPEPTTQWGEFRSKIGPPSLFGAAIRGDMNMVRLALYPPSRSLSISLDDYHNYSDNIEENKLKDTNSALVLGVKPGSVRKGTKLWRYIYNGARFARSPEVHQYLTNFLEPTGAGEDAENKNDELADRAENGDVVMVRYLLELGADPSPSKEPTNGSALSRALRRSHGEVVDLLLDRGADINARCRFYREALVAAVKSGSMALVSKLLDAGLVLSTSPRNGALVQAVKMEHTAMTELILRSGSVTPYGRRFALELARREGLESMAALVRPWVMDGGERRL